MDASSQPAPSSLPSAVGSAYDAIAGRYDRAVAEDAWMRRLLWRHYARVFAPGDRVLDLACGTGLDSLFLAGLGVRVVAVDVSAGMVMRLGAKLPAAGGGVLPSVQDAERLAFAGDGLFDGAVSAFAGLNTVRDLPALGAALETLLRPGARFVAHVLAPGSVWTRRPSAGERTVVISGSPIRHSLATAEETYERGFAAGFELRRLYSLGFLWPQGWNRRLPPALAHLLGRLEPRLGALPPFRRWGRFFVLDLERRAEPL